MSADPEAISPCPFCGHVGLAFDEGSTFRWLAYRCAGCGMGSEVRHSTMGTGTPDDWLKWAQSNAIYEWNRRTPAAQAVEAGGALTDAQMRALCMRLNLPRVMWDTEGFRSDLLRLAAALKTNSQGGAE